MNIIKKPNAQVIEKIGLQVSLPGKFHRSVFCIKEKIDDGLLLCNTMTQEIIWMPFDEYYNLKTKEYLAKHWFLISNEIDEGSICLTLKSSFYKKNGNLTRLRGYTIFTGTGCNAACSYCYEAGSPILFMDNEIAEKTFQFIKKTHSSKFPVSLRWFGGEPLINAGVIRYICSSLNDVGIPYESGMITNGIMLSNKFNDDEIKYLWKLKQTQITFEGTEEEHNRIKRVDGVNAFQQSIAGVQKLLRCKAKVLLRLHVREDNLNDMLELVNWLANNSWESKGYLRVYAAPLFDLNFLPVDTQMAIAENCRIIDEKIRLFKLNGSPKTVAGFKSHHCMADNGTSVCISPDGKLTLCEHHFADEIIGDVENGIYKTEEIGAKINGWSKYTENLECKKCWCYPSCLRLRLCDPDPNTPQIGWCAIRKDRFKNAMMSVYNRWKAENQNGKKTRNSASSVGSRV